MKINWSLLGSIYIYPICNRRKTYKSQLSLFFMKKEERKRLKCYFGNFKVRCNN